jgi:hypothetical protein
LFGVWYWGTSGAGVAFCFAQPAREAKSKRALAAAAKRVGIEGFMTVSPDLKE